MTRPPLRFAVLAVLLLAGSLAESRGETSRYVGVLADGTPVAGSELRDWKKSPADMKLDSVPLFDPANPVVWLQDNSLPPSPAAGAFVEFHGGDLLPGEVTAFYPGSQADDAPAPPYLEIATMANVGWPVDWEESKRRAPGKASLGGAHRLRVRPDAVQRVVWQRRGIERCVPGTLFYRDGRQVSYRGVKWTETGLRVLRDDGPTDVSFHEVAELHMPRREPWDAWFDQLAYLAPEAHGRLVRVETVDGVVVTLSTLWDQNPMDFTTDSDRGGRAWFFNIRLPRGLSTAASASSWHQVARPPWSLDAFWIDYNDIRRRHYFELHEAPLACLEPETPLALAALAASWAWENDRNVQGGTLRSAGRDFGWGVGVHAPRRLEYPLAASVRAFRTQFALDQLAENGGCVRGFVLTGPVDGELRTVYASPVLVGSHRAVDSGPLDVAGGAGRRRLVLVADPVYEGRPEGADPLEIRDVANWLEPLFHLDPDAVRGEILSRVESRRVRQEQGPAYGPDFFRRAESRLDKVAPNFTVAFPAKREKMFKRSDKDGAEAFQTPPRCDGDPSILRALVAVPADKTTSLELSLASHWLGRWQLAVMANGRRLHEQVIDTREDRSEWTEVSIDLSAFAGQMVALELYNDGTHPYHGGAHWRRVEIVSR
jgi:hypothetical protein